MSIIDISLPLHRTMITYPGNTRFRKRTYKGKTSYLSEMTLGTHTGTHIDAPRHVFKNEKGVDKVGLERFIGNVRVIDFSGISTKITVSDLQKKNIKKGERILVKTKNSKKGFKTFYKTYVYLDGDAAHFLAKKGIILFGIDFISVKQSGSDDNRPHTELLKKNIPIIEGVDLHKVSEGEYFLSCLPLMIIHGDGAPTRACLMPLSDVHRMIKVKKQ